jgi:hypothetical protein
MQAAVEVGGERGIGRQKARFGWLAARIGALVPRR